MTCAILMGHLSGLALSRAVKFDTLIHIVAGSEVGRWCWDPGFEGSRYDILGAFNEL